MPKLVNELPFPDPKIMEMIVSENLGDRKRPGFVYFNQKTWRSLVLGPSAKMWTPFIHEKGEPGEVAYRLVGIDVKLDNVIRDNCIRMVWEGKNPLVIEYVWPQVTKELIGKNLIELAGELKESKVLEDSCIEKLKQSESLWLKDASFLKVYAQEFIDCQLRGSLARQRLLIVSNIAVTLV